MKMNTVQKWLLSEVVHQDNDNHYDSNFDAGNTDGDRDATGKATASRAKGGTGTTNFNLSVKQNKIPEFFGTKSKQTIWPRISSDDWRT
jgi:hypothetical protein